MYSKIKTAEMLGLSCVPITVETDFSPGLPAFNMVGTLAPEVRESRERIQTALRNIGIPIPPARITVGFFPADTHKYGTAFDLPIAVGILNSMGIFANSDRNFFEDSLFLGELGLDGKLLPVKGILPIAKYASESGIKRLFLPLANAAEAGIVADFEICPAESLHGLINYLQNPSPEFLPNLPAKLRISDAESEEQPDFADVYGQSSAKRAATISAAGFHSLLMTGPPGSGKSMIAKRIPGLLPPMTREESLEVTSIYSVVGKLPEDGMPIQHRKLIAPHHSLSTAALIGGGAKPVPGQITLAHRSVLFLDELTEFHRSSLDSLRQPLEEHKITISRAQYTLTYPADFLLVCAMNPCPCGHYPNTAKCHCTEPEIRRYLGKISGPILDRIDLCVELKAVDVSALNNHSSQDSSELMREAVIRARQMQQERFKGSPYRFNSEIRSPDLEEYCRLEESGSKLLHSIYHRLGLSARSYHRILRVARTIADLDGSEIIQESHILEAVTYRPSESYWNG